MVVSRCGLGSKFFNFVILLFGTKKGAMKMDNTEKLNMVSVLLELMGDVFVRVDDDYMDVTRTKAEALQLADKLRQFGTIDDLGVLNENYGVLSFNTFDYKISAAIAYEAL